LVDDENARLQEKVRKLEAQNRDLATQAMTDPLTGLLSHRASHERLEAELRRAERERYSVAVVALDLDFFKGLNDSFGHEMGDKVLRRVAQRLVAHLRPGDICGRLGGDEFVVGLVRSTASEGEAIVERLRAALAEINFDEEHPLTMSAGIARFPFDGTMAAELLALADQALYHAKATGRNRCVVHSPQLDDSSEEKKRVHERSLHTAVEALARAVDTRNGYTHLHSQAVAHYATGLGASLGFTERRVEMLRVVAVLHDVGKIGVPDAVLWKMTPLTPADRVIIRGHSELGHRILTGLGVPGIPDWVLHLHERYDGCGYPAQLAAEEIPLESRILAVADALDVMICPRVYREPITLTAALAELESCAGSQFDPSVVRALIKLVREGALTLPGDAEQVGTRHGDRPDSRRS
jgi:diguanylate cyclase (GGDEF)-like protein